jgi:hypothetical protein
MFDYNRQAIESELLVMEEMIELKGSICYFRLSLNKSHTFFIIGMNIIHN